MQIGSHMFYIWMNINLFIKESLLCFICTFNINRNKIILSLLICFIVLNLFIRFNIGNNLMRTFEKVEGKRELREVEGS